jgi:serine/threonine protein kinase
MVKSLQEEIGESLRIVEVLRQNDSESLVEARDLERHVPVVLKVLDLEVIGGAEALPGFEREAASAVGFRHRNIATAQPLQRRASVVFYALNVGYAKTLESLLSAGPAPSFERAIAILQGIADALDYEHSQGSMHGRLAPEMIFVDGDRALVSGFGGMQDIDLDSGSTATLYQAPEQRAWRQEIDGRVDVYALGVIAYELLSGRRLSRSATSAASSAEPLRISRNAPLAPGVGLHVNEAILHAIAKRPSQRFATAGDFVLALGTSPSEPVDDAPEEPPNEVVVLTAAEIWTRLLDGPPPAVDEAPPPPAVAPPETEWAPPRKPRRRLVLPPRFATSFGIGCLCVAGALTIYSVSKRISVQGFQPAFAAALSHLSSPLKAFDKWRVQSQPQQAAPRPDSGLASPHPGVTKSGVVVENGVLVFPGEKSLKSGGSSRGSAQRRTAAAREITKPTAH